jgi:hypothetical protein
MYSSRELLGQTHDKYLMLQACNLNNEMYVRQGHNRV